MDDREFLFLVSSTRRNGNAETLARRAAASLPPRWEQRWLHHLEMPVPQFLDIRHSGSDGRYEMPTGHLRTLLDATLAATDIVFVAPVYWYSLPAAAKLYLDHWSGWLRVPGLDFRARMAGKRLWAVSIVSDPDRSLADPLLDTLRLTAEYMKMEWAGAVVGFGNRAGDVPNDEVGMTAAAALFRA
jgi:NAD(P)H-dependent FMN reductase